jgi:hypothetical protein
VASVVGEACMCIFYCARKLGSGVNDSLDMMMGSFAQRKAQSVLLCIV